MFAGQRGGLLAPRQGRADAPDLTLRQSLDDFADVVGGRADPRLLLLRRRMRPSGSPRVLLKLPKLLG